MLKKLLIGVVVVLVAFVGFVATRPDTYHVERSAVVAAPPEAVFAALADFKTFPEWSPWAKRDPAMRTTLSSPSSGVGATYAWEGNNDVGKGKMTIVESTSPTKLRQKLEFLEPFASEADTGFEIKPEGTSSKVTWSMDGKANFMSKAMSVFMDMDKMIGKDFEDGLANLKRVVESAKPAAAQPASAGAPAATGG